MIDTSKLVVGDKIVLAEPGRMPITLTVWDVSEPGRFGTAYTAGPHISAHIKPGGYGITFDSQSFLAKHIFTETDYKDQGQK